MCVCCAIENNWQFEAVATKCERDRADALIVSSVSASHGV